MDSQTTAVDSKKKMSTQKKTIIALSAVIAVILIALITVVSVWAASSQTVSSTLTVTYSATNVSATVKGDYMRQGDEDYTSIGSVEFKATEASQTKSISSSSADVSLTDQKLYVIFRYTFTNDSDSLAYKVTLTNNVTTKSDNISVKYASSANDDLTNEGITGATLSEFTVAGGETVYAYILVNLDDITNNASYSANVGWNLAAVSA